MKARRSAAAKRLIGAIQKHPIVVEEPKYSGVYTVGGTLSVVIKCTRSFLLDAELSYSWRLFLWFWFIGRHLAAKVQSKLFVR